MRLVKLSDLSEEERRKALEEQQKRLEINNQERQRMQENANNEFNNIIAQNSTYNTRKADYGIGNIDLNNRPVYHNEDGSISTVRSMSFWDDNEKKEILIPTISFDKNGKAMSLTDDEAINRYYETGEYLGKFDDWKEADKYAEELHKNQERLYNNTSKDINQQTSDSLWDKVINTSKIFQNLGLGISNGLMSFKQQIGRVTTNSIADREDLFNETKKDMIEKQLNKNSKSITPNIVSQLVQKENKGDEIRRKAQETNEEIQKKKDINTNIINENIESMGNSVTKKLAEVSPSIGQMLPAFLPGGAVYMAGSATGQYYDDAKQRGMNEEEANTYSGIMGLMEGATEMIGIGNIQKAGKTLKTAIKGTGKEALKSVTKGATKSGLKSALRSYGIGIADNVIQEALIDPIQEFTAEVVAGKDKAQWEDMGQRMLQDGINGGLVSAILGGANLGIQSCVGVVQKQHSNQKITEQEFKTAVKDASKQLDTTQMITSGVEQQLKKYTDYYTGKTLDDDVQNTFNRAQNIINNNQNSQQKMAKNQFETQEVIPNQNESALKSNMIKNENLPKTAIKDFNESAKKYNIDYNNEDLKEINQMFNKREITAYFDENTFKNNNEAFSVWKPTYDEQGNVSGREVVFNPKAQDTNTRVQELAIHELGHDLDLNEIQSMILKDASKKENWESARKSLENTYRQAYENDGVQISDENFSQIVDEEATMNILQRELGSQEYVNRLVNQNQSIAKKIYNWVIDKLNKFTGGKNEKIFWADIKNKFETAYNQEFNKNKNNLKYSVIYNKDGSFNRVKIDDNIFENNKGKSINNTIKEYLEKNINEYANIIESGQKVYLGKDLPGEYTYSKSAQNLSLPQKMAKGRAATELKEIISNVTNREYSNYKKEKHVKDAKYGFYKYDTKFSFEQNSKEQVYTGTVLIRNDANGKKYLYDILNIKKVGSNLPPVASNSQKSSAKIGGSKNIPTNSLPSTQQNVNSKIQKYSMQESEKNTQNTIKINNDGEAKYIDNKNTEQPIYFRFDLEGQFKEKEHKSGVSMWEDRVDDMISDNYDFYYDENDNDIEKNKLLEKYGVTQQQYDDMSYEEQFKIKQEIALDEGYVTNGASVFDLSDYGADFFFNYEENHHYLETQEVHFFTGEVTGEGADGENVVIPEKVLFKGDSKDIKKIYDELYYKYDLQDSTERDMANKEFTQKVVDLINKKNKESENNSGSFNLQENKQKQLDIINKNNKMQDDYHTEIRKVEDIKTLAETLQDSDWIDYDEFEPDYTRNMANEALKTGKITVYSSYPIKQGTFVSPSRMEAESYSGNGKIFSKEINIEDVAWIDPTQGQYANINQKYALPTKDWQQFVEENYQKQGTGKSLKEYNLPIKENVKQSENNKINPFRTSKEIANDKNISDLEALKEESQKINTLSLEDAKKLENELNKKNIEKSPTIDYIKEKRSRERVSIKEIKDTLAQKFVNKGHYIDKLANKTGNKNLTYLYDRTMNTFNEAQISIGDYQINSKGNVVGKSIIDIFKNSDDMNLSKEFDDYLLNKHNISRYAHEKGIFGKEISTIDSQGIINNYDKKYPQFKKWAKEVSKYNDNNLKDLVDNGLVSKETYKKLKEMYKDYVPTFRDISDNISQYVDDRVGGNTLKRATESNLNLLSVRESMAEQTLAIKKAIRINNLGIELYNVLGNKSTITTGIDFDVVALQTLAGNVIDSEGKGKNTFTIFQDGEMTQFKISDELYSAFSKDTLQNKINNNKVAKALLTPIEKMSKAQRELLTTYSIGFAINNPIKDFQDALFNSKYNGATFMKNWTKALYNIATNGSWYKSYKNNGGTANTYFDYSKGILPTKTNNPIKKFGDKIKYLNEVLEQAPRLAEYISTIEHKGTIDEALYNAADITTNFKRGGDITKAINKYGANFLNASVQGLDKIWRNISGKNGWKGYANLAVKATAFQIAPAIINGILLGNDDDYDKLPDYTKDNYFLFKMEDGKFFRIPKGRLSSVIGGIARRSLEAGQSKDVKWNSLVETTINQLAPNNPMTDNVFAPIIQAKNNKTWFGGDIVNTRLKKLPTAEQYDESTDNLSKFLGKNLNISPKKINYVLDQYSGGVGDVVLPMMTPQAENNILEDKFTTDSVIKNKNVSQYYSEMEKLEKTKNSTKATDEDKIKYKYFTDSSSDISDLYGKKRDIQNSDISDKDKKEQVRNIQKQINDIVENKLSNVNKLIKKDKYAQIDNCQYYKDIKGDWNQLSDEEKEKNKSSNISLKTYSDYKYQISKLKQEKVNKKELEKSEQLKDKDKIQVLINSNYSEVEKTNIYKNYIGNKDKKEIVVEKLGLPINEYLKYKSQTFVSDKDENGETIKGSKNEKIYNYLNNIKDKDLSQDYKKVICKMSGINTYDKDIVDNINNNKSLTTDERKEILTNIGFKIDKNNKIKINSKLPIIRYIK